VLIELDYRHAEPGHQVLHASVKSTAAEADTGFYITVVELEFAHAGKILSQAIEAQTQTSESIRSISNGAIKSEPVKGDRLTASPEIPSPPPAKAISHVVPGSYDDAWDKITHKTLETTVPTQMEKPIALRETVKSAVASEMKQELEILKTWISSQIEETLQGIVSTKIEKIVGEGLEKRSPATPETSELALAASVARQLDDRIAELRLVLEAGVKKLFADQTEFSQATSSQLAQQLSSQAAALTLSVENSTAEISKRLADEQAELSRTTAQNAEQRLTSRAAEIMRAFQESTSEMARTLLDQQAEISRSAGDRVEQDLSSRVAAIMRSFEEFTAESAKRLREQQTLISRTAADAAEREQNSRAATILRSFEESTTELETRMNTSRAAIEAALSRSQSVAQEINAKMVPLQQALLQLDSVNSEGIQTFKNQVVSEMNRRGGQFEDELNDIARQRAIGFAEQIESRLAPNQRQADELLEKLGSVFQLMQSTARVQQERLTEHSRTTAANFEQEIRSILLRFAGGSQL
jgi:DNA anti-recombination protein RmuC